MKKLGAEAILLGMILPWGIWVTVAVFNSQKVEAVQETKYQIIIDRLEEIKGEIHKIR